MLSVCFVMLMHIVYSCVLQTFDCLLSVWFCYVYIYLCYTAVWWIPFVRSVYSWCVYMYPIQLCAVKLSLYVVCMFCQVNMYSIQLCAVNLWFYVVWGVLSSWYVLYASCVLLIFDSMLYEGFCHEYIYYIQLYDVNLWLHFVFVVLSWAYVFNTAVCCLPLIVCCMCVVACLYVVNIIVCCLPLYAWFC
jgi:hypothetical protein